MSGTQLIGWLWRDYMKPWRWWFLAAVILMSLEGSMSGLLSYLIKPMFDQAFAGATTDKVVSVALAVAGTFIVRALAGFSHRQVMARIGERVVAALQDDMLAHLLRLDQSFFKAHSPGNLMERVRGDSAALRALSTQLTATFGRDLISFLSLLGVALWVDWVWTLVAVAGVPLLLLPLVLLQRLVRRTSRAAREAAAENSTRLDEIFHGITTIQLAGTEAREAGRYSVSQRRFRRQQLKTQAASSAIPALIDVVAAIGFAGVLIVGGLEIIRGEKTVGDFMSFFTAMALIFDPLRRLGNVSGAWQATRSSLERVAALVAIQPTLLSPPHPVPAPQDRGRMRIVFDSVHFAYEETPVLNDLGFVAEAGQTTAIVGPSGAGKSTLFALLARMADPQAGAITLAGIDLRAMDLRELRGLYSIVSQETALFDETIRDNILMGREGVDEARMQEVLRAAHLTEVVARLPQGLDTPAGPRGSALSGGQRQRVAIARALMRDAPILLLDEATSALDAASEAMVQEALERLSVGRTTLVIAHRLATVRNADKIVVMEAGRVVETGRHEELVALGGRYAELSRLQFSD